MTEEKTRPTPPPPPHKTVASFVLALGITLGGFFPGYYYYKTHIDSNTVTVKGLAEMDVVADLAIWKLKIVVTDNDLQEAQRKITSQANTIRLFLEKRGFKAEEIRTGRIETNDLMANPYRGQDANNSRFILNQSITVKSNNVVLVEETIPETDALVAQGIVFDNNDGYSISYVFTKLNEIKPKMITEATQNAKKAAAEFAKNSGSLVGKIRRANQGVFSILPREQADGNYEQQQINKTVRVVSTIEYWLE